MTGPIETALFALGGGVGACARHAAGLWLAHRPARATAFVNVLGSGALGLLAGTLGAHPGALAPALPALIGFCGGFTTFSSFARQTLGLNRSGGAARAAANAAANLIGSVGAFLAGAALAGALPGASPGDAAAPPGAFAPIDCPALTSPELDRASWFGTGAGATVCGLVTVPAERDAPDGRTLELAVYRVPSLSATPAPDPVVYLEGGPGGAGVTLLVSLHDPDAPDSVAFLRERGEVIVVDQRGTGYSRPALYCPEVWAARSAGDDETGAHAACAARLRGDGVRFADYDSRESAADLETVRTALGIERWNLYGVSYGARLALTAMRDAPAAVRAAVLDSVFPVEVNGYADEPWTTWQALERIAAMGDARPGAAPGDTLAAIAAGSSAGVAPPGARAGGAGSTPSST